MRLAVDGWRLHGQRTGVGRYILNVLRHWEEPATPARFDKITVYSPQPLDRQALSLPAGVQQKALASRWPMLVWDNLRLGPSVKEDVLWCPSYSRPLMSRPKTVVTLFEATLKLYPHLFPPSSWYASSSAYLRLYEWSARHATLVLTCTESAKQDLIRAYHVPAEKIRVVPLAPLSLFHPSAQADSGRDVRVRYFGEDAPYFLYVGKLTPRRNVPLLMEAFAAWRLESRRPHRLVVIGLNTTALNLEEHARQLGIENAFVHKSYVSDEDLEGLYRAAYAFVLPYSYEALSLTAQEAQASGLPVITCDTPGLREVTGGLALYMKEPGKREIADALETIAADPALRDRLAREGITFANQFTWERTARETMNVLWEAAGARPRAAAAL